MPALCYNAAMKFQCINGLLYTHNDKIILNVLLELVHVLSFTCVYTLYVNLPEMFYLSDI